MPIFDFKCDICKHVIKDEFIHNDSYIPQCCGEKMRKLPSRMLSGFPEFGLTLTNVEEKPVHFSSKKQLLAYKRKHNLQLGALPYD